jgi:2-amino-4-hydroxy-6-hydroxymethyldihydropteridine diphosphokinase
VVLAAVPAAARRPPDPAPRVDAAAPLAYVGLGANLGDAPATLRRAWMDLAAVPGVSAVRVSSLWRSAPVQAQGPDFFNAVAELRCTLAPMALLEALWAIEQSHGRERPYHHAPRTLDLDLLLLGGLVLDTPRLTLPHPRLHQRAFVLRPLLELWPEAWHPTLGRLDQALPAVADQTVERLP